MNRKLLALAITAALTAPFAAQAAPTVYGQLNLSVDMVDLESTGADEWQVNSNSSRLGVKGEEDLGNGYSAVYKVEGVVDGDGDIGYDWDNRDRYLGLKGNWGTVKLGNYDSPLKSSQGTVDQFNDMNYLDMANVGIRGDNRLRNSIGYESPKIADSVTVKVTLQPGETTGGDDGPADAVSASVAFEQGGLYLAAAIDKGGDAGAQLNQDNIRVTATYTMDALQLGALVQTSELSAGGGDEESALLSAAYTAGKNVFKGQLIMTNEEIGASPDDQETMVVALGMDHNFTGMTKAFAQLGMGQTDNVGGVNGADADDTIVTVGMQTKF